MSILPDRFGFLAGSEPLGCPPSQDELIAMACRIGIADSAAHSVEAPPPDIQPVAEAAAALAAAFLARDGGDGDGGTETISVLVAAYEAALNQHYREFLRKVGDLAPIMHRSRDP